MTSLIKKKSGLEVLIISLIIIIIVGFLISQTVSIPRIIVSKNFSPTFSWYHNWQDINGNPEQVSLFHIRYIKNKSDTTNWYRTEKDTVNFQPPCTYTFKNLEEGLYEIQVRAVDYASNVSNITSSLEFTADKKGWYYLLDCTPPITPTNLKIQ